MSELVNASLIDSPEQFATEANIQRWRTTYGQRADDWLAELPDIASGYAQEWGLTLSEPLEGGSVSAVIGATQNSEAQDSTEAVLKVYPPWVPTVNTMFTPAGVEATALRYIDGDCAPRALANDSRALLLERIDPGTALHDMTAEQTATLIQQFSKPVAPGTRTVPLLYETIKNRYDRGFSRLHPAISCGLYNSAFGVATALASVPRWNLVHGDLKPKNVLERSDGSLAAIDPDAAIGHFAYDAATWAIDKPAQAIDRAIEIADCLKIDPRIIGSWILVLAIPEICLVSEKRAMLNLELIKQLAKTSDLERYYAEDLIFEIRLATSV